jgi:cytochrome c
MKCHRHAIAAAVLSFGSLAAAGTAEAERGRLAIAAYGCASCHSIPGIPGVQGEVGPPLNAFGRRVYIAGLLPNTPAALEQWLLDPPSVNPRTAMPNLGVTQQEARDMAAYLLRLR